MVCAVSTPCRAIYGAKTLATPPLPPDYGSRRGYNKRLKNCKKKKIYIYTIVLKFKPQNKC